MNLLERFYGNIWQWQTQKEHLTKPSPSLPPKNLWQPKSPKKTAISAEKNMKVQLEGRYKSARVLWKPVW